MATATVSEEKSKPTFDEQTLGKLLEAAFVLQEHNRESRKLAQNLEKKRDLIEAESREPDSKKEVSAPATEKTAAPGDYTVTLGKIVETQRQIQVGQLELHSTLSLVAKRVAEMSRANGAAIGFVDGQFMHYRAVAGPKAPSADSTVPADKALSFSCINTGQVVRYEDCELEGGVAKEECQQRGIRSLVAAPVYLQGNVAGSVELYYAEPRAFTDQDVHTCQLMAGLVTEALVRDEELTSKRSLATERAAMLEALEKLQPNLAALVEKQADARIAPADDLPSISMCAKCGHELLAGEQFCGECGSPRIAESQSLKATADTRALEAVPQIDNAPQGAPADAIEIGTQAELEFKAAKLETSPTDDGVHASPAHPRPSEMFSE